MVEKANGLTERQRDVLAWIKNGQPAGVYDDDEDLRYRGHARRLERLGLVAVSGSGDTWKVSLTELGERWPDDPLFRDPPREEVRRKKRSLAAEGNAMAEPPADASTRTTSRVKKKAQRTPSRKVKTKKVAKKETYMRYRVLVTRVQVAERWVRATDEEHAAQKVQEEFSKPYGYFGSWKTTTSEVEVVEAEQTTVIQPNPLADDGPMLLSIKDSASALGISYSMVYSLINEGEVEWTQVGSRKYISRESLMTFIKDNTHKGYYYRR